MHRILVAAVLAAVSTGLIAVDAEARLKTPAEKTDSQHVYEPFGFMDPEPFPETVATKIANLDADREFSVGLAGSLETRSKAIPTPHVPRIDLRAQDDVHFHDMLAISHGQSAQQLADEAEQAILTFTALDLSEKEGVVLSNTVEERSCLAEAIYYEARGESLEGQIAVAEVVLNRVASPKFPDSVCGVIEQGAHKRNACQFSYKCDGKPETMADRDASKQAKRLAERLLSGEKHDISNNATHYHATYVSPSWSRALRKTAKIGTHIFYRH